MPSHHLFHQATQIFSPNPPFARTSIPLEFGNTIWRADWIPALPNITRLLDSCLPGSNKMNCFPFWPLMPLWALCCRSPMCHSEIKAGLKPVCWSWDYWPTTGFPTNLCPPSMGKPRHEIILRRLPLPLFLPFYLSFSCFLTTVVHKCSQLPAPPCH